MKYLIPLLLLISTVNLNAQDSTNIGVYLSFSLQGTAWTLDDYDYDGESGSGFKLEIGYNINSRLGFFIGFDGSEINADVGENYALGHFDLGAIGKLGKEDSKVKPFGKLSLLGFSVLQDNSGGDIEFLGSGIGIGLGSDFFISSQLAINLGYTIGAITIDEVSIGDFSEKVEESASSGRFNLGLVYYF